MISAAHHDGGRAAVLAPMLLLIAFGTLTAACASTGRNRARWPQSTPAAKRAGVIPGSWERVEALSSGSRLVVTLKSGNRVDGAFKALQPGELVLIDRAGKEIGLARSDIGIIADMDTVTNGTLVGAGIGAAGALAILAILGAGDGYVLPSAKWGAPLLLSGVGSLVGILVDRAHKGREIIYLAP